MNFIHTLRYTVRKLFKSPATSGLAILALGFGIGLTAIMYSLVYGAVLRGLPFEEGHRLMHVECNNPERNLQSIEVSQHDFLDFREQQTSFESLEGFDQVSVNLSDDEAFPERYRSGVMSAGTFAALRVEPFLGRDFTPEDTVPGAPPVALLGYSLWRDRFGEDRGILGKTVRMNGTLTTIIGVMPLGLRFPMNEDLWTPLQLDSSVLERGQGQSLEVFGRLKDGVSLAEARAEMATIASRLAEAYPESNGGQGVVVKAYQEEFVGPRTIALFWAMMIAVSLVLLIACANVAGLLLARTATRTKELAIRGALGARRGRLLGLLLMEGLVLSAFGALLGLGIAYGGVFLLSNALGAMPVPFWVRIALDPAVLLLVVAATVAAGVLSALLPGIQASRTDVNEVLKDENRGSSSLRIGRLSRWLVTGEIALACALLVATALMVRTIGNLSAENMTFATADIFTAGMKLPEASYPEAADRIRFYDQLVDEVQTLPGVASVALMSAPPGPGMGAAHVAIEGREYSNLSDYHRTFRGTVTPEFFSIYEIPVSQGRLFDERDVLDAPPVVIVNQSFAAQMWPGENPINRRLRFGRGEPGEPWRTVVGVVPDAGVAHLRFPSPAGLYVPHAQMGEHAMSLAVKNQTSPGVSAEALRAKVRDADPDIPLYAARSMEGVISDLTSSVRLLGSLFSVFGLAALILASVGIYGIMTLSVSHRTQEIGVRMALGAQRRQVLGLVLRQGMWRIVIGLAAGWGLAFVLSKGLRGLLFDVEPGDPSSFVITSVLLVTVALVACLIPAYRAARVDPMRALHYE